MAFDADVIFATGLAKIELPGHVLRLCDGGRVTWGEEAYEAEDAIFGTIESVELPEEAINDEAPGGKLVFLPKDIDAVVALSVPENQNARMRFWFAEYDPAIGAVVGTPELVGDMRLDTTELRVGMRSFALDVEFISAAHRLMNVSDGNVLSTRFHQKAWPGETGLDLATGAPMTKAWGVQAPPQASVATGGLGGGGGGNGQMRSAYD
jgi:hypothetical protein